MHIVSNISLYQPTKMELLPLDLPDPYPSLSELVTAVNVFSGP